MSQHLPTVTTAVIRPSMTVQKMTMIMLGAAVAGVLFYLAITNTTTVDLQAQANESMSSAAMNMVVDVSSAIFRQTTP